MANSPVVCTPRYETKGPLWNFAFWGHVTWGCVDLPYFSKNTQLMKQLWVNLKEIEHNHVKTSNFRKLRMPEINSNYSNCYRSCWFHLEHVQLGSKVSTSGEVNKAPAHVAKIKTTKVHVHATTCPKFLNTAVLNSCKHSEELMGNKTAVCVCVYFAWILFGNLHDNNISFARSNAFFCWHNSTALEFRCTRSYSISWWFPGRLLSIGSTPRPTKSHHRFITFLI